MLLNPSGVEGRTSDRLLSLVGANERPFYENRIGQAGVCKWNFICETGIQNDSAIRLMKNGLSHSIGLVMTGSHGAQT